MAEAAGAAAEEPRLLREQQVQLPPLQQPPRHRDQREGLEQSQERAGLLPSPPAAGKIKAGSEPAAALGSAGRDTPHVF